MIRAIVASLIVLTIACSTSSVKSGQVFFDEIIIRNAGSADIQDLTIHVSNINGLFACSTILARSFCSNRFALRHYQGNAITVSWSSNREKYQKEPFTVSVPDLLEKKTYVIELILGDGGAMQVDVVARTRD